MRELDPSSGERFHRGALPASYSLNQMSEGRDPRLRAPEDQGVDVVRAFVCVHRLEVHAVADDVVLVRDAVCAVHVAGDARDVERLAARVALQYLDDLGRRLALVDE